MFTMDVVNHEIGSLITSNIFINLTTKIVEEARFDVCYSALSR